MKTTQIELSNLDIIRGLQALQAIDSTGVEFSMTYTMSLNLKTLRSAVEDYQEFREEIIKQHCMLDSGGNPVTDEDKQQYVFESPEVEKANNRAIEELNETKVSLNLYVYPLSAFAKTKISHVQLEHLLWMVRPDKED